MSTRMLSHWGAYDVESRDGRVTSVTPFEHDQEPSPLIEAMPDVIHHECRIASPMIRKGWLENGHKSDTSGRGTEDFVQVSWEKALDLVATELTRVKDAHGNEAIFGPSGWASAGAFHRAHSQISRFLNCFGGFTDQVTNYSFGSASVIVPRVVGSMDPVMRPTSWSAIAENTRLMVLFGGIASKNSQVANNGIASHDTQGWMRTARDAGVSFVQFSPMRDDMAAELGAEWLSPRPNTDTAIMMGLAHTLVAENLHDSAFLEKYCEGFDRFRAYLVGEVDGVPKDADWAAEIAELDADFIRTLARRMASERTMISISWSVQRSDHGEQPCWMAITLAAMLGQLGLPGGGVGIGYGSDGSIGNPMQQMTKPNLPMGRNPTGAYIPMARVVDMLLNPGGAYQFNGESRTYPDIKLLYWAGGNPFHKQQDINRFLEGWRHPETVIVHEPWWTPAARRADIVLPVATSLERNDIGGSSRDRYMVAMQQAIPPVGEARKEYDIYSDLAGRLGFRDKFTEGRNEMEWLRHMYDLARQNAARKQIEMPDFDAFWEEGHFAPDLPEEPHILFAAFRKNPVGAALRTPSGKIEIFSETIDGFGYDDCPGHPTWMEPSEWLGSEKTARFPLHMISNQPRYRLHSQLDFGGPSQANKIQGREAMWVHPIDAAARGLADGDIARVFNDRGACLAGVTVTDAIRPGVIRLPTGAWFDPLDSGEIGSIDKHGNPNMLTLDKGSSRLAQSCTAQSTLVEIERFEDQVPAITAYDTPATVVSG